MDAIAFEFSRWDDGELSGFDLGDITVSGPHGVHSSSGKTPDQSVMIYIALAHLITGVCELVDGTRRAFEFVGTDSSYSLIFAKKKGAMVVRARTAAIAEAPASDVLRALSEGVQRFLSNPRNQLLPSDSVYEDLQAALVMLKQTIEETDRQI